MTARAASARASPNSKSSMRCSRARSSRMARMAALEISGPNDDEEMGRLLMNAHPIPSVPEIRHLW